MEDCEIVVAPRRNQERPSRPREVKMQTLAHREAEAKLDRRIVEGPYEDRHAGYPLLKDEYYKKDLNPSTTHKRYKLINIPVLGRILVRFLRYR